MKQDWSHSNETFKHLSFSLHIEMLNNTGNFLYHKRFGDLSIISIYIMNKSKLNNEDIKEFLHAVNSKQTKASKSVLQAWATYKTITFQVSSHAYGVFHRANYT